MGFWANIWHAITDAVKLLVETIVRPVVQFLIDAIDNLKAEIRYWKHAFMKMLAKWMENDFVFLLVVVATITLAVYWPKIVTFLKGLTIGAWLKGIWESVKQGFADVLSFIHFLDLKLISDMLKVVWPEWRKLMGQMADVVSALSEELGQGAAYIHAYFSVVHNMAILGNSLLGIEPELAELQAFEDTNAFLVKIDERFQRYVHNPGEIVRDIIEEVYLPYARNYYDSQQGLLGAVRTNYERYLELDGAFTGFSKAVNHFIEVQPDVMQEVVEYRLGEFARTLEDTLDSIRENVGNSVRDIMALLQQREQDIATINFRLLAIIDDPYNLMRRYETLGNEARARIEALMGEIVAVGPQDVAAVSTPVVIYVSELFTNLARDSAGEYGSRPMLTLESEVPTTHAGATKISNPPLLSLEKN